MDSISSWLHRFDIASSFRNAVMHLSTSTPINFCNKESSMTFGVKSCPPAAELDPHSASTSFSSTEIFTLSKAFARNAFGTGPAGCDCDVEANFAYSNDFAVVVGALKWSVSRTRCRIMRTLTADINETSSTDRRDRDGAEPVAPLLPLLVLTMHSFALFEAERNQDVKSTKPFEENTKVASFVSSHGVNFTYSDTHGRVSMSSFSAVAMRKLSTQSSIVGNPSKATIEE